MKKLFKQKPSATHGSIPFRPMRDIVEHQELPQNPERRVIPRNRSEVVHPPGASVQIANYNRAHNTFDISVIPTSVDALVIDKALGAAAYKLRAEAAERGEKYDEAAEDAVLRFNGPLADMRREERHARHERRPAEPVMFRGYGAEMILTGLSELVDQGERREQELKAFAQSGGADPERFAPSVDAAQEEAKQAESLLLTIGGQINGEIQADATPAEAYLGSVAAIGADATIDLPGRPAMASVLMSSKQH